MLKIQLFVSCHKKNQMVPSNSLLYSIQVGSAITKDQFESFYHDDTGENISSKNHSYCELTAQYWAWKNIHADYYGFFHYRRYLFPLKHPHFPYYIAFSPTDSFLSKCKFSNIERIIEKYDFIMPIGENIHMSVREHYSTAPFHHEKDLSCVEEIIKEKYPDYVNAMKSYLNGNNSYFGNIFIMKREIFYTYCNWLFPILEEFDKRTDKSSYSEQELRVNGYLAERLLGIYYTKNKSVYRTAELPRVHFYPNRKQYIYQKAIFFLFPPGTKIRNIIKKIKKLICD